LAVGPGRDRPSAQKLFNTMRLNAYMNTTTSALSLFADTLGINVDKHAVTVEHAPHPTLELLVPHTPHTQN